MGTIPRHRIEELKARIDVRDLASRHTRLSRESRREWSGPCPKCGGDDRFHCQRRWFFCSHCHSRRYRGDCFDFLMWLEGCSFRDACEQLDGHDSMTAARIPQSQPGRQRLERQRRGWRSDRWQAAARREVAAAAQTLADDSGSVARSYLQQRGIESDTWHAFTLGHRRVWHPQRRRKRPAVVIPWQAGGCIKAVQYRFVGNDITPGERFS